MSTGMFVSCAICNVNPRIKWSELKRVYACAWCFCLCRDDGATLFLRIVLASQYAVVQKLVSQNPFKDVFLKNV